MVGVNADVRENNEKKEWLVWGVNADVKQKSEKKERNIQNENERNNITFSVL